MFAQLYAEVASVVLETGFGFLEHVEICLLPIVTLNRLKELPRIWALDRP